MQTMDRICNVLRYGGPLALARAALHRLLHRLVRYRDSFVLVTPPPEGGDAVALPRAGLRVEVLDEATIRRLADDPDNGFSAGIVRRALAKGDRCLAVLDTARGTLAYFCWFSVQPTWLMDGYLGFDRRCYYAYHAYCRPEYRGLGLAGVVGRQAAALFGAAGCSHQILVIDTDNFRSLHAAYRRGSFAVGRLRQYRLAGRIVTRVRHLRDDFAFDWSEAPTV